MPTKCHLNGVSLAGQWWPAFNGIWITSPLTNWKKGPQKVGPPLKKLSGSAHVLWSHSSFMRHKNVSCLQLLLSSVDILYKQFGQRSEMTKCCSWSESKSLDTLIVFLIEFLLKKFILNRSTRTRSFTNANVVPYLSWNKILKCLLQTLKVLWIFKNILETLHDLNDSDEKTRMLKTASKNSNRVKSYNFKIMKISI